MTLVEISLYCILNAVLQSSKHKEISFPREFICVLSLISLGAISLKNVAKNGWWGKNISGGGGLPTEEGANPSANFCHHSLLVFSTCFN